MAMSSKLLARHIEQLEALSGATVEAGWFETDRYPGEEGKPGELTAVIARKQEYGFTTYLPTKSGPVRVEVPARPFMRYAYELFLRQRKQMEINIAKKIFSGKISAEQALGQIGMAMENCITDSIKNGPWIPNAPLTIKLKGFDKPLIDSGHLWQTVSSKVTQ